MSRYNPWQATETAEQASFRNGSRDLHRALWANHARIMRNLKAKPYMGSRVV